MQIPSGLDSSVSAYQRLTNEQISFLLQNYTWKLEILFGWLVQETRGPYPLALVNSMNCDNDGIARSAQRRLATGVYTCLIAKLTSVIAFLGVKNASAANYTSVL